MQRIPTISLPLRSLTSQLQPLRSFSTSLPTSGRSNDSRLVYEHSFPPSGLPVPPYPYGPNQHYKQSNFGLYSSLRIRFGNKVSAEYKNKSRRAWRPNVHHKKLWSECLDRYVRTRVATRTLRSIDKAGGLDNYLLGGKSQRIKDLGMGGWKLRWMIMQSEAGRERLRQERIALGLPAESEVLMPGDLLSSDTEPADLDGVLAIDKEGEADEAEWVDEDVKVDGLAVKDSPKDSLS